MARKKNQAYTEEFRREAVKRAEKEGNTTVSVARELGVSAQQIYNWPILALEPGKFNQVFLSTLVEVLVVLFFAK
ncbi:MAG: hypothetical protein COA29_01310, partial [Porticoccus sp.]